jgi:hypothetical protein
MNDELKQVNVEITDDPAVLRAVLAEIIRVLRGPERRPASRAASIAVTKLQEARYWLGDHMMGEE